MRISKKKNKTKLPIEFKKYFWEYDFKKISWEKYPFFVTERILNFGNGDAVRWLLSVTSRRFIRRVVTKSRELDKKTKNFWRIYGEQ